MVSDSDLRGTTSSRQGRTLFNSEDERTVGLRTRALLEAARRPGETPSFEESLEVQSRWRRDGEGETRLLFSCSARISPANATQLILLMFLTVTPPTLQCP